MHELNKHINMLTTNGKIRVQLKFAHFLIIYGSSVSMLQLTAEKWKYYIASGD